MEENPVNNTAEALGKISNKILTFKKKSRVLILVYRNSVLKDSNTVFRRD